MKSEDLITSFKNLVISTSGNKDTLEVFNSILHEELERISNPGDTTPQNASEEFSRDNSRSLEDLNKLVTHHPSYADKDFIVDNHIIEDIEQCYENLHGNAKYAWLSCRQIKYKFGSNTYQSIDLNSFPGISKLRNQLNNDFGLNLDSCLLIRYKSNSHMLTLHQDDEEIFDENHPICTLSIGTSRHIEFWDGHKESEGKLVCRYELAEGTLVTMHPGCQTHLWHKVPRELISPSHHSKNGSVRYALSFRKLKPDPNDLTAVSPKTPENIPSSLQGCTTSTPVSKASVALQSTGSVCAPGVSSDTLVKAVNPPNSVVQEVQKPRPRHLLLGDSMVKGLNIHDESTVSICKGGIHPKNVLRLLPASVDILSPSEYNGIKTVTLIVGTNALNVRAPARGIPLLDIVFDYESLIHSLTKIFPNAKIGLYNVIPRAYNTIETKNRIVTFNEMFSNHVTQHFHRVYWIRQYWDFIDDFGFLRQDLYGKDGVHLKPRGKQLMRRAIVNFQHAYM